MPPSAAISRIDRRTATVQDIRRALLMRGLPCGTRGPRGQIRAGAVRLFLRHGNLGAERAGAQPLAVDFDATVVGILGVELLEERERAVRALLEMSIGLEIAFDVVALRALLAQGLEDAERLGLALDDHHAHRPERDAVALRVSHLGDAGPGAEVLVESLEARGGVHGVAQRSIFHLVLRAEVPDRRLARVNADARHAER